eukprot:CAMPEP_0197430822 /NCGR_PEP_ID=MMETSP1170-20131217/52863_1 /TAXON_ID=54406 /ORGANISM="Sarcinochrysis sp, Strain CCMP770" /LENGTH=36 /DNA_ID= /DNA_START= /DNA_END= /DNA_ORIENTATION=
MNPSPSAAAIVATLEILEGDFNRVSPCSTTQFGSAF